MPDLFRQDNSGPIFTFFLPGVADFPLASYSPACELCPAHSLPTNASQRWLSLRQATIYPDPCPEYPPAPFYTP